MYQNARDNSPYLSLRIFDNGDPWVSVHGAHELCVEREDNSLRFKRWSRAKGHSKLWAVLCFTTWEGKSSRSQDGLLSLAHSP